MSLASTNLDQVSTQLSCLLVLCGGSVVQSDLVVALEERGRDNEPHSQTLNKEIINRHEYGKQDSRRPLMIRVMAAERNLLRVIYSSPELYSPL